MKQLKRILCAVICMVMMVTPLCIVPATAASDAYADSLRAAGFPESYISSLCALHDLHPTWNFTPLLITQLNSQYTWSYVISQEMTPENRNLIYSSAPTTYRKNNTQYDSGWYPVTQPTVEFFMDPRNFLNEKNIFMFENLSYTEGLYSSAEVETVLAGTFMANTVIPGGDGRTYAQLIFDTCKTNNINPLHAAARVRLEQGTAGTSPLISGTCGNTLWQYYSNQTNGAPASGYTEASLKAYNGYYNFFNIGASGNGYFNIYLNGMKEAVEGGWTTRSAAIVGGIQKLASGYIGDYQNILYLQKFNVDPRSGRNFWGQYMQNVTGAWNESRSMCSSYRKNGLIDAPFGFLVPVFSGMPDTACKDPGTSFTDTYSYINTLDVPTTGAPVVNGHCAGATAVNAETTASVQLRGWSLNTTAATAYQYSLDGGSWVNIPMTSRPDVLAAYPSYTNMPNPGYDATVAVSGIGQHNIAVRGVCGSTGETYLISTVAVTVTGETTIIPASGSGITIDRTSATKLVLGVSKEQTVTSLSAVLNSCHIVDLSGNTVTGGVLGTGFKVQKVSGGVVFEEAVVIVPDDLNGDGITNGKDVLKLKKAIAGNDTVYVAAVDYNSNGQPDASDLLVLVNKCRIS